MNQNGPTPKSGDNRLLNTLFASLLIVAVIFSSYWVVNDLESGEVKIYHVFIAAFITAATTGFGAIPFLFIKKVGSRWLGYGNALAAGLMFGASVSLVYEGVTIANSGFTIVKVVFGLIIGAALVFASHKYVESTDKDYSIGEIQGANALKMLMIVAIMTVHSFAEGIGVGVSFGDSSSFGSIISVAIAIHNIPEGLAISLVLIPRGASIRSAALWSIFSSLPQPIMAVPAFLFVLTFKTYLPIGLGIAAGAMFWMVFKDLLPEARDELSPQKVFLITTFTAVAMILFQFLLDV